MLPWEKSPYADGPVQPVPDEQIVPGLVGAVVGIVLSGLMVLALLKTVASF